MNWNGPLTAKQFVILFWVPVLILAVAAGFYHHHRHRGPLASDPETMNMAAPSNMADMHDHAMMAPPPPPPSKPVDPKILLKEQEELHRNIEGVKQMMNRSEP